MDAKADYLLRASPREVMAAIAGGRAGAEFARRNPDLFVANSVSSPPAGWLRRSLVVGNQGHLDSECGYPNDGELTPEFFHRAFSRWGLAQRANNLWPDECWAVYPDVYETESPELTPFEAAWADTVRRTTAFHYLHRGDSVSGIGRCGILFLGLDDGGPLDRPPAGTRASDGGFWGDRPRTRRLNFVRAFDETLFRVSESDRDPASPRFGLPTKYAVNFSGVGDGPDGLRDPQGALSVPAAWQTQVHWTRVVHLADNRVSSEVYGTPRLRPILNYLWDVRKVGGGSSEMFWKGGFPGYVFEANPDLAGLGSAVDVESLTAEVQEFSEGLRRYMTAEGGKWVSLQPQVANPDPHLGWLVKMIAATIGVPYRVFIGAESGHMASTQDDATWRARCAARQKLYLEPMVLCPFVDRLIQLGCLPAPAARKGPAAKSGARNVASPRYDYSVQWRDLRALGDTERANVALKKVQALMAYTTGAVEQVVPVRLFLTLVMGFTEAEADAVVASLKERGSNPLQALPPQALVPPRFTQQGAGPGPQGGGRKAQLPPTGRGKKSPPSGPGSKN